MPECPECGGDLVVSVDNTDSRGTSTVYECEHCNTLFDFDEVDTD